MNNAYTREELETMLQEMERLATGIYLQLVRIGCHPFIEFCGLMREYVKVCKQAHAQGVQFPFASGHGETALPASHMELQYLAEKLHCIFSPMLRSEESRAIFQKALFGEATR
jgi:hypothetical protein